MVASKRTIEALRSLKVKSAYLDGELCALNSDGVPVFSRLQAAMDEGKTDKLVFFAFDVLFLNGQSTSQLPLIVRKERLKRLFKKESGGIRYSEHVAGDGGVADVVVAEAQRPARKSPQTGVRRSLRTIAAAPSAHGPFGSQDNTTAPITSATSSRVCVSWWRRLCEGFGGGLRSRT